MSFRLHVDKGYKNNLALLTVAYYVVKTGSHDVMSSAILTFTETKQILTSLKLQFPLSWSDFLCQTKLLCHSWPVSSEALTFLHHVFRQVSIQGRDNSILIVSFVKSSDQYYFHLLSYTPHILITFFYITELPLKHISVPIQEIP